MNNKPNDIDGLEGHPMTADKIKDWDVFGNAGDSHPECCLCCAAYCSGLDTQAFNDAPALDLWTFDVDGVEYVTNDHLAVRADLIEATSGWKPLRTPISVTDWPVPATKPGPSTATLGPVYMHLLDKAGLDIRDGGATSRKQHIYRGAEHVGWLMPTRGDNGVTLADLPALREIAEALPVTELEHPMTTATRLLLWERHRIKRKKEQ